MQNIELQCPLLIHSASEFLWNVHLTAGRFGDGNQTKTEYQHGSWPADPYELEMESQNSRNIEKNPIAF